MECSRKGMTSLTAKEKRAHPEQKGKKNQWIVRLAAPRATERRLAGSGTALGTRYKL
jgi:hypothetical protein